MWRKGVQKGCLVTLCNACGIRLKRGKCCPYCQVTYGDAEQQEVTSGSATKGEHTRPGAANAAAVGPSGGHSGASRAACPAADAALPTARGAHEVLFLVQHAPDLGMGLRGMLRSMDVLTMHP